MQFNLKLQRQGILLSAMALCGGQGLLAQGPHPASAAANSSSRNTIPDSPAVESRLQQMADLLRETQRQLEQTRLQMKSMSEEIEGMQRQIASGENKTGENKTGENKTGENGTSEKRMGEIGTGENGMRDLDSSPSAELADSVARQREELDAQQAEIRQHEQTKIETESKYSLRLHGLLLFNAYSNAGVVDNITLPSNALPRSANTSHGSLGGTMRQTVLGFTATGPKLLGAKSSAELSTDFFSSASYNYYGNSVAYLRLRRADIGLQWRRDALHVGVDTPLISPLSPTSYAAVGVSALGWAGNLWSWSPQLRYIHTVSPKQGQSIELEAGLWDVPVLGINAASPAPIPSAGEASRRPGVEARVAYRRDVREHPLVLGLGGYTGSSSYSGGVKIQTWTVTADWQVPITHGINLSGEIYRGVGLGGFGGGVYKDVLSGTDRVTGVPSTIGLNAVGGWAQIKASLPRALELNVAYGQDGGFAGDFRRLDLSRNTNPLELSARNRMIFGNLIFKPKTYLVFSPEYRRIDSWETTGAARVANVFTLSAGYQF